MSVYRANAKPPDPPPPSWWEQNRFLIWEQSKVLIIVTGMLGIWIGYMSVLAWAAQKSVEALLGKEIPFSVCLIAMIFFSPKLSSKRN
jgi:hypothetical protein